MDQLRLRVCSLVKNGSHLELQDLFAGDQISPNYQSNQNGLAPVHYVCQLFSDDSEVSIDDINSTIKVMIQFGADFSLTASIKDRRGVVKHLSVMDMVVNSVRDFGPGRIKYEKGFLPNFKPYQITRALREVPTCAPHPDLIKKPPSKWRDEPSPTRADLGGLPPSFVRLVQRRTRMA